MADRFWSEQRAMWELGAFGAALPWFSFLPRGDGHPVVVLPGMLGDDRSTMPLRRVLRHLGHSAHGWGLGRNDGPDDRALKGMTSLVRKLYNAEGRPVSLVGWSMGGVYARALARNTPHQVRQVITMGSPFKRMEWARGVGTPPVPVTSIYSRSDAVVPWGTAVEEPGPRVENVEVEGSHIGLGFNPAVVVVVADRLAQPEGEWKPFKPPAIARQLFPRRRPDREDAA
jgi:hypothetical protein